MLVVVAQPCCLTSKHVSSHLIAQCLQQKRKHPRYDFVWEYCAVVGAWICKCKFQLHKHNRIVVFEKVFSAHLHIMSRIMSPYRSKLGWFLPLPTGLKSYCAKIELTSLHFLTVSSAHVALWCDLYLVKSSCVHKKALSWGSMIVLFFGNIFSVHFTFKC